MIPGALKEELTNALTDAYTKATLTEMLSYRLDKDLGDIVNDAQPLRGVVFDLMKTAEEEGWELDFVREAQRYRPKKEMLLKLYEKLGMAPKIEIVEGGVPVTTSDNKASAAGLQKVICPDNTAFDMAVWRSRYTEVEARVCRIDIAGKGMGTGFLVGPEVVLTNYHVVQSIIEGKRNQADVSCLFDYKVLADKSINAGTRLSLAPDKGILAWAPYSASEKASKPDEVLPTEDELDFALLRLERAFGAEPEKAPRGFEVMPTAPAKFVADQAILIAQHPAGVPMKLALDTKSVIGVNANGTRVRYRTNTEGGSSGSPVYNITWKLVALHHYGDPSYSHPAYNQGVVPLNLIRSKIEAAGFGELLGNPSE